MRVYFDSSAFAKRYIDEDGTGEVWAWCERARELALSVIAVPELISAFRRLQREGRLTATQYQNIKGDLMADITDAIVCDTTPRSFSTQCRPWKPTRCAAWTQFI